MNAPEVQSSKKVNVDEISVASDAGWRDADEAWIAELLQTFYSGSYGYAVLTPPSVLQDAFSTVDSKMLLVDGKAVVTALQRLKADLGKVPDDRSQWPDFMTDKLADVLKNGLRVDFVTFSEPGAAVLCVFFRLLASWQSEYASSSARGF